jgi:hypothetical protein
MSQGVDHIQFTKLLHSNPSNGGFFAISFVINETIVNRKKKQAICYAKNKNYIKINTKSSKNN